MPLKYASINRFAALKIYEPKIFEHVQQFKAASNCSITEDNESSTSFHRFLDLPHELRDKIYSYVLVPDSPIEFAPIYVSIEYGGEVPRLAHLHKYSEQSLFWNGEHGGRYHRDRYMSQIQPSLMLMRVSKQIKLEATPVYYGQEFRFTNPQGWHILHHWLKIIGHKNRQLLRHLVVGYPALTALEDRRIKQVPPVEWDLARRHFIKDLFRSPLCDSLPSYVTRPGRYIITAESDEYYFQKTRE